MTFEISKGDGKRVAGNVLCYATCHGCVISSAVEV
jgi:hypothetical protein